MQRGYCKEGAGIMEIRTYLKTNLVLFDGAMGTYYAARNCRGAQHCELANLHNPAEIEAIHRAYAAAGCDAIKTNTFGANRLNYPGEDCAAIIHAGVELAKKAAGRAWVFADIGPITATDQEDLIEEYRYVVDLFLAEGVQNFIFETHARDTALHETAAHIREKCPEAFILFSFAAQPDGFTCAGELVQALLDRSRDDPNVDAAGINCVSSARHMVQMMDLLEVGELPFSVLPNAGYPTVVASRTYYHSDPDYFAQQMEALVAKGARILGGCCGTTPEHIAATALALRNRSRTVYATSAKPMQRQETSRGSRFWEALCDPGCRPFAVELDPPENTDLDKFLAGAQELKENGAAIITIADCPVARARMDSSLLACKLRRELQIEVLPHMTCRDRNLNATKALLLGLSAEQVDHVLVVTGDPIPTANRDEVKSVYNFNSRLLAGYISALRKTVLPKEFRIYGALNLNALNFHVQLRLAKEKEEKGMCALLTQPVLTPQAFENLKLARRELHTKILGGIFPIVSQRNAQFIHSEVSGILVDERIIRMYEGADREKGEALAEEISLEIGARIAPYVDGFYFMTPFGRTGLISRIMERFRQEGLDHFEAI